MKKNTVDGTGAISPFSTKSFYGSIPKRRPDKRSIAFKGKDVTSKRSLKKFPTEFIPRIFGPTFCWKVFYRQMDAFEFAQNVAEDVHVFSFESCEDPTKPGTGQRRYLASSLPVFWHYYSQLQACQRQHYEIIPENAPCKLYFDLEFQVEPNTDKDGNKMVDTLIKYVCLWLGRVFGLSCDRSDVLDLDASTPRKHSRHLVFQRPDLIFENNVTQGDFVRYIFGVLQDWVWSRIDEKGEKRTPCAAYSLPPKDLANHCAYAVSDGTLHKCTAYNSNIDVMNISTSQNVCGDDSDLLCESTILGTEQNAVHLTEIPDDDQQIVCNPTSREIDFDSQAQEITYDKTEKNVITSLSMDGNSQSDALQQHNLCNSTLQRDNVPRVNHSCGSGSSQCSVNLQENLQHKSSNILSRSTLHSQPTVQQGSQLATTVISKHSNATVYDSLEGKRVSVTKTNSLSENFKEDSSVGSVIEVDNKFEASPVIVIPINSSKTLLMKEENGGDGVGYDKTVIESSPRKGNCIMEKPAYGQQASVEKFLQDNFSYKELQSLIVSKEDGTEMLFCDLGVYTKNRNFRLYMSSKLNKNNHLKVAQGNEFCTKSSNSDNCDGDGDEGVFYASLITNVSLSPGTQLLRFDSVSGSSRVSFPGTKHSRSSNSSSGSGSRDTSGFLFNEDKSTLEGWGSTSPYPEIDGYISSLVSGGADFTVKGSIRHWNYWTSGQTLVYDIVGHRWCHNVRRHHRSNNIMYVVDIGSGVYYQKCHDPDCQAVNYRSPEFELPRHVLPGFLLDLDDSNNSSSQTLDDYHDEEEAPALHDDSTGVEDEGGLAIAEEDILLMAVEDAEMLQSVGELGL